MKLLVVYNNLLLTFNHLTLLTYALNLKLAREDLDASSEVLKWETLSNDSNRTPDLDPLDLDKYQVALVYNIAEFNF